MGLASLLSKEKRKTELSGLTTTDIGLFGEDAWSSLLVMDQTVGNSSLNQPIDFESMPPCCSESTNEKSVIAEDPVSVEVDEKKSLDKQPLASEADLPSQLPNVSKDAASELVHNEIINVAVDRTFVGYNGKKLLVLDVNGLLADISSFVPYDYDPDEIIMKKAGNK